MLNLHTSLNSFLISLIKYENIELIIVIPTLNKLLKIK